MAVMKVIQYPVPATLPLEQAYDKPFYTIGPFGKQEVRFSSNDRSAYFEGKKFVQDPGDLTFQSGTISRIIFSDTVKENAWVTVAGLDLNAGKLNGISNVADMIPIIFAGNDKITGRPGASDHLVGYGGKDTIKGLSGDDALDGGLGVDFLFGGAGNDTLTGGDRNNRYTGGAGSDIFVLGLSDDKEVITDFDAEGGGAAQDHLDIGDNEYYVERDGGNTIIDLGPRGQVILIGIRPGQIDDSDFVM